ncbi:MAG: IS4 family transposase [Hyphomicrobiales bacterium]|nr:MAG: IS4 family transposase [Hyphomicrobiales bacterium]
MSFYHPDRSLPRRFGLIQASFLQSEGLPFAEVLSEAQIQQAFADEGVDFAQEEDEIYTPPLTLWGFLSQVLHKGEQRSCMAAVSRILVLLVVLGREPCAKNTGAYCRARAKLPEKVIERLAVDVARGCEAQVPRGWLWHQRHVKMVDGTTCSMPDTEENRAVYPQPSSQKEGLGFPLIRLVVALSLATAMLCSAAMGPYSGKETGETALLREVLDQFAPGDILLADRYFCSFFMIALLLNGKCDFVTRLHQRRKTDFSRAERLGKGDHLVVWKRPEKPDWMDDATYEQMPLTLTLRQVEVQVHQPGFRTESLVVVTTLLNAKKYRREEIADLYRRRWQVELDIEAIKITLGMDVLRCQKPEMVRKEIWTCLLAYNLIRKTMLQAAHRNELSPRQLSFATAVQTVAASWMTLPIASGTSTFALVIAQLDSLAQQQIGDRPNRVEPRAVKRRPKPHRLLTKPRKEAQAELLRGVLEPEAEAREAA